VFSPDGSRIIFSSSRKGPFDLYETSANGSGKDQTILESAQTKVPSSWSADGRYIVYDVFDPKGTGIWALPLTGDRKPFAVVARNFVALAGQFSRDTQWIAYQASESGRFEVYVQSFPNGGERRQVSLDGGAAPQWRADGKELYFLALDNTMMAVSISSAVGKITSGKPVPLFKLTDVKTSGGLRPFAVAPDGQRFLVNVPADTSPIPITMIFNWHPPK
jgi:Tol biopolymer transport system component